MKSLHRRVSHWTSKFVTINDLFSQIGAKRHPAKNLLGVAIFCVVSVGCSDDVMAPVPSPIVPSFVLSTGVSVKLKDVRELTMDLAPTARPWDESDSALVAAVHEAKGKAFVGFKKPGMSRVAQTARMAVLEAWRPEVLVKKGVRAGVDGTTLRAGLALVEARGGTVLSYYDAIGVAYVEIDPTVAAELRANPLVDYLEPDVAKYELAAPVTPNSMRKPASLLFAQTTPWGISAVRAPEAWALSTGSGTRLLIIDTGHQQNHEDLAGVPSGNCLGNDSCTDLGNYPHGTWVSGVAIARNNSVGVVGVAPGISSSDVFYWGACGKNQGEGCDYANQVIQAFNWAAGNLGSRGVISMSQYSLTWTPNLSNAVAAAWAAGHVIVASAGNKPYSNTLVYPAAFSNVVGVSGLNQNLTFSASGTTPAACLGSYSNYGTHVDLSAPFDAYTTDPTNTYSVRCGTSFATPHVAGTALLVRAANPGWDNAQVVGQMTFTAQGLGTPGYDTKTGYGIVRADLAAGLYKVTLSASLVSQQPQLTWDSVPLAAEYRIYRRIFVDGVGGEYQLWSTTTGTTWTDFMSASSFYGYSSYPTSGTAVTYDVVAVSAGGFESPYATRYATFIPDGEVPQ